MCECYAVITDPERADVYEGIHKNNKIPLLHGKKLHGEFIIDVDRMNQEERGQVIIISALRLGMNVNEFSSNCRWTVPPEGLEIHRCVLHRKKGLFHKKPSNNQV